LSLPGVRVNRVYVPLGRAKLDISLTLVAEGDGGYAGFCSYDADRYHAATIARVASGFTTLLGRVVTPPDETLAQVAGAAEPSE
jgi:hypothetical protein